MHLPNRIHLAHTPTPIVSLPTLSNELGVELRVKRDDLTGSWLTGNKIRKLEYLIPDAQAQGCNALITFGAVDSNHCRATAIAAAQTGMACHLILRGREPEHPSGNLLLDRMAGATVQFVENHIYLAHHEEITQQAVEHLAISGKKAYIIPTGGSNAIGALGYIHAIEEIQHSAEQSGWIPDTIIVPVGSGGTLAGVLLGCWMYLPQVQVLGINVCDTAEAFREKVYQDCCEATDRFQLSLACSKERIVIQDGYVGAGYAQTTDEQLLFYAEVARQTGLFLEPVYTGKTFWGMVQEIRKGRFKSGSNLLFLHTGGIFGLEAYSQRLSRLFAN